MTQQALFWFWTFLQATVAGGIYDGTDMENALKLGADGVQVATRFVTTYECDASDRYKQAYIDAFTNASVIQ